MTISIRYRRGAILRAARAALAANLSAILSEINTDLAAEGARYRLPTLGGGAVAPLIVSQGEILPTRAADLPIIRVVMGEGGTAPSGGGGMGRGNAPLFIWSYLAYSNLTIDPDYAGVSEANEATLIQAVEDFGKAVELSIHKIGAMSGVGLEHTQTTSQQAQLFTFTGPGNVDGAVIVNEFRFQFTTRYSS